MVGLYAERLASNDYKPMLLGQPHMFKALKWLQYLQHENPSIYIQHQGMI